MPESPDGAAGPDELIGASGLRLGDAQAGALRQALAAGTLTSAEFTACYLDRIGRLNPLLRAVTTVSPDALAQATRQARESLDGPLTAHRLDAVVAVTATPAWLTDHVLGDHVVLHTSGPAAVAGYPAISVPAGHVRGLPVGLSFMGPAWSEPRLIALAYAFEQAAQALLWPGLRPAVLAGG